jgi:hypothetical protein
MNIRLVSRARITHSGALLLLLCALLGFSPYARADSKRLSELLVSLSTARGDAVGRATRVQSCPSLMRQKGVADLILKYDDARTAHNAVIGGWIQALTAGQLAVPDIAAENRQLARAQQRVQEFSDTARAAILRSNCLTTKTNWGLAVLVALLPVAADKLWDYFKDRGKEEPGRQELIRDLQAYMIPAWGAVGPVAMFDWKKDAFVTLDGSKIGELQKEGAVSVYVNKHAMLKEPNRYFSVFKEPPPALKGAYFLYTGPLEELSEYAIVKDAGGKFFDKQMK